MGYLFDPEQLHALARGHLGKPPREMFADLAAELAQMYPGHIATRENWLFSLAGGAIGIMTVVHGSFSEYIIIFGTPTGTIGYSGRYWMNVYDVVLTGEMWTYTEEDFLERKVSRPGDMALLRRGQSKGFKLAEDTWLLEYGRGFIPASLPFALSDALISCLDWRTVLKTFWVYGKLVLRELLKGKL